MNRLRVRVELNRRGTGVPMQELVSVVEETRKFFHLLAEDVEIPVDRGEWQASHFDPESLNFTAEYNGPASAEQIHAFGLAFAGATSLRRETIAQFTHIADFIGEDELVGFGLYQSDQESDPSDWRCLSKRDASRFADEIQLLAKASGESVMPAVMNASVGGRRLFKDRREREALATDPSKWIREVESSLSRRIGLLEREVEVHTHKMNRLGNTQESADERFLKLLGAMESFWNEAPRPLLPAGTEAGTRGLASLGDGPPANAGRLLASATPPAQSKKSSRRWKWGFPLAAAGLIFAVIGASGIGGQQSRFSRVSQFFRTSRPASAASSQPSAQAVNAQLVKTAVVPSGLEASDPTPSAGQQKTVSAGSTPAPAGNSSSVQIERARSDSGAGPRRRDPSAEIHQIALEVPADLKTVITEQVLIDVSVDIDPRGKVTAAEIASTKGEQADLLASEALKAARRFRFRPNRRGSKAAPSQTVLTFVFEPDIVPSEGLPPGN